MTITESERLVLRELEPADEAALACVWGDAGVMRYCGGPTSIETIRKVIRINRENFRRYGYAVFAVIDKSSGALIGAAGCKPDAQDPRRAELIYHFMQAVWGRGMPRRPCQRIWNGPRRRGASIISAHPRCPKTARPSGYSRKTALRRTASCNTKTRASCRSPFTSGILEIRNNPAPDRPSQFPLPLSIAARPIWAYNHSIHDHNSKP